MNSPDGGKPGFFSDKKSKKEKEKSTRYRQFDEESVTSMELPQSAASSAPVSIPANPPTVSGASGGVLKGAGGGLKPKKAKSGFGLGSVKRSATSLAAKTEKRDKTEKKERKKRQRQLMEETARQKEPTYPVFGVPLKVACERSISHDGLPLPAFFRQFVDYIEEHGLSTEGIYRVPGLKSKVQSVITAANHHKPVILQDFDPTVIASAIKAFIRDLPEPILTISLTALFEESSSTRKVSAFKELIGRLPEENRYLLAWVILHMNHVISRSRENQMTLQNVSIVFSPTLNISHRTLNLLCANAPFLFPGVTLRKYLPPLRPAARLELPDTGVGIEEELSKQESLLACLHKRMKEGPVDAETETGIWEVQRIVTQLKRKLTLVQLTAPETITLELSKHQATLDRLHEALNTGVVDKEKEDELWAVQRTITMLKRKLKQTRHPDSWAPREEPVQGDDVMLNLTLRRVSVEDSNPPNRQISQPPAFIRQSTSRKKDRAPQIPPLAAAQPANQAPSSQPANQTLSSLPTNQQPSPKTSASDTRNKTDSETSAQLSIAKDSPQMQAKTSEGNDVTASQAEDQSHLEMPTSEERGDVDMAERRNSTAQDVQETRIDDDDLDLEDDYYDDDEDEEDARSGTGFMLYGVDGEFETEAVDKLLVAEDSELKGEYTRILYTADELNAIRNDLRIRIRQEKEEIVRLQNQISHLTSTPSGQSQLARWQRGEDSDSTEASSGDEDDMEAEVEAYRHLVWDNQRLERENLELVDQINAERNQCVDLKVSLRRSTIAARAGDVTVH